MNEIEKLYENAGVEAKNKCKSSQCIITNPHPDWRNKCESLSKAYPSFSAEKQIELIKWLSTKELKIRTNKQPYALYIGVLGNDNTCFYGCEGIEFTQTLAELINTLWQDLTEEEKEQIKEILQ